MKNIILISILMTSFVGQGQVDFSEYKYIVIPKRFDAFKKANQHRTSTLVKHLFSEKGFATVYDDNLPAELYNNRCMGLFVDLIDDSSMFTTKVSLVLNDCEGKEFLLSDQGKSKKKDYEESFGEATNDAFQSFQDLKYTYKPKREEKKEEAITISFENDVKTVEERPNLTKNKDSMVAQEATEERQYYKDQRPTESDFKKPVEEEKKMVEQVATEEEQRFESKEPIESVYEKSEASSSKVTTTNPYMGVLYAQALPNGYQLVDSTPKIQLKIYKSSMPNVYIAKADDKDGVVYTSDGKWFFEYYDNETISVEELNIKF